MGKAAKRAAIALEALARPVLDSGLYTFADEHAYLTLSDFGLLFGCDVRVDELAGVVECST